MDTEPGRYQPHGLDQWIDYVRFSLADIVVKGEWDDFGIFRFLNRVSFMFRKQLVFLITHTENYTYLVDEEISAFDPIFKEPLLKILRAKNFISKNVYVANFSAARDHPGRSTLQTGVTLNFDVAKDFLIPIFDTTNNLIVFEVKNESAICGRSPEISFDPIHKESVGIGYFLSRAFQPFDGKDGRMALADNIESRFSALRTKGKYIKAKDIVPEEHGFSLGSLRQVVELSRPMIRTVDHEYERFAASPLLKNFQIGNETPVNIAFFAKNFCRGTTRFNRYYFDPVFVIGKCQRSRILRGLADISREQMIPYPRRDHDDRFWSILSSGGPDTILEIVQSPLSRHLRIFTENVLMSGTMMITPNIFEDGGIGWVDEDNASCDEIDQAFLHLVCLHYILQLGAPTKPVEASNLSIVSLPFRCSGGIWMCASFLREHAHDTSELIDQRGFEQSYCIYHSLMRESERRLRRKAKYHYLRLVGSLAAATIPSRRPGAANRPVSPKGPFSAADLRAFNSASINLGRIYPFPVTLLCDRRGQRGPGAGLSVDDIAVKLADNPFFDRLTLRDFLAEEDIKRRVQDQIRLSLARQEADTEVE